MRSNPKYSGELDFLNEIIADRNTVYRGARFLKSPFAANEWTLVFGNASLNIDFNVLLPDGESLASLRHRTLLDDFKMWICVQDHFDATGGKVLDTQTLRQRVQRTLHAIDYLLLHAEEVGLAKFGLAALTANDLRRFVATIASHRSSELTIYQWPTKLAEWLLSRAAKITAHDIATAIQDRPELAVAPDPEDMVTDMSLSEVVRCRSWLWHSGHYVRKRLERFGHGLHVDLRKVSADIYRNTLWGRQKLMLAPEFSEISFERHQREFDPAPVSNRSDDRVSDRDLSKALQAVRRLGLLSAVGSSIPLSALESLDHGDILDSVDLKETLRFKSLPHAVVFSSLRNAIEFVLIHGDHLVTSFLQAMKSTRQINCRIVSLDPTVFNAALSTETRALGVRQWTINSGDRKGKLDAPAYFAALRENVGLWELLRVLYGAGRVILGSLSGRRAQEYWNLMPKDSLDTTGSSLIFRNGKSGVGDLQEEEARPVPRICVRVIRLFERLQDGLKEMGALASYRRLLAFPSRLEGTPIQSPYNSNKSLDSFCDYFQTPVDEEGRRYYIRHHQLRRFVALVFFWAGSFGGLETLRWFLAHTNLRSVWRYISENTPGSVLRQAKGDYAAELVLTHAPEAEELSRFLQQKIGVAKFSILEFEELEAYVEELLLSGEVSIEPTFFETEGGQTYRMQIVLTHKDPR